LLVGRFTYMASAPFGVLLALTGAQLAGGLSCRLPRAVPRPVPALALTLAAAAVFGALTMEQNSSARARESRTACSLRP
jgi:hypothetical protein